MVAQSIKIQQNEHEQPEWLDNFVNIYSQLSVDNLHLLEKIYHEDIIFTDPMHSLQGFTELKQYFEHLYANLSACKFTIVQIITEGNQAAIYWQMRFCHKSLNKGKPIEVNGSSQIQGLNDKVTYHRDFVDLGEMLYENLPFIGRVIRLIKQRASKNG
ncbi:nuclear transport factor 2 family protein [Colwellia sp. RSH04]|uniref:nuclear transport factor 2 family protein n=1 Tax=Colwellia sp. RSH04 TaxID=2305464 RepID=UPI000E5784E5|nr:nuclear transport factor 2 family protein [Colwellia sp. RSH04]RHW75030.1 nuclear transport factor 2 family protein [Colwellia sp. RSH04]